MGRERPVTSPVTAAILLLLAGEGPLSSVQIARRVGVKAKDVHAYLRPFMRAGLVAKASYTFTLTEAGERYVEKYARHLREILRGQHRGLNLTKLNETRLNQAKRIVDEIAGLHDISGCEGIVRFLVEFRLRTGRLYWWPSQPDIAGELAEAVGSSSDTARECLARLESQGVIYARRDPSRGVWKIRLSRHLDHLFTQS